MIPCYSITRRDEIECAEVICHAGAGFDGRADAARVIAYDLQTFPKFAPFHDLDIGGLPWCRSQPPSRCSTGEL